MDRNGLLPPLEEKTERPNKGLDQPKTKEEAVDRGKGQRSTTAYAEWATKAKRPVFKKVWLRKPYNLIHIKCYMLSADYEHSRVVMPKGRGETSGTKEAPEKENEAKVPEHFKELVERTRELCLTPAHTNQAGG